MQMSSWYELLNIGNFGGTQYFQLFNLLCHFAHQNSIEANPPEVPVTIILVCYLCRQFTGHNQRQCKTTWSNSAPLGKNNKIVLSRIGYTGTPIGAGSLLTPLSIFPSSSLPLLAGGVIACSSRCPGEGKCVFPNCLRAFSVRNLRPPVCFSLEWTM